MVERRVLGQALLLLPVEGATNHKPQNATTKLCVRNRSQLTPGARSSEQPQCWQQVNYSRLSLTPSSPLRVIWLSLAARMLPHRALPDRPTCTTRRSGVRALSTYLRLETKRKRDGPPPSNDRLAKECAENRGREEGSERINARRCIESESRVQRAGRDKSEHALWHGSVAWLSWRIVRHSRRHSFRCICVLPSGETRGVPTAPSLIHQIHPSALLDAA